jgi:hypothetical protein
VKHASPADLVDLAEGVDRPGVRTHLDHCAICREELTALEAMLGDEAMLGAHDRTEAGDGPDDVWEAAGFVPEPSPLFWTHFPRRVGRALEQAMQREPGWWAHARLSWTWPWLGSAMAAALILGVVLGAGLSSLSRDTSTERGLAADARDPGNGDQGNGDPGNGDAFQESIGAGHSDEVAGSYMGAAADDAGWAMLLLMADTAVWEETDGVELFLPDGAAERAVFDLSLAEREELQRLLASEIGNREVETS